MFLSINVIQRTPSKYVHLLIELKFQFTSKTNKWFNNTAFPVLIFRIGQLTRDN